MRHEPASGSRAMPNGAKVDEVCRRHGISSATFYTWRKKCGGVEASDDRHWNAIGPSDNGGAAEVARGGSGSLGDLSRIAVLRSRPDQSIGVLRRLCFVIPSAPNRADCLVSKPECQRRRGCTHVTVGVEDDRTLAAEGAI